MSRIGLAFRAFFRVLGDKGFADGVRRLVEGAPALPEAPKLPKPPARSEAVTLLAVLQREARLVDFLKEDIRAYSDAQIGAAVRDVHRDAAVAIDRMFAIRPLRDESEGANVTVPAGSDAARVRLTGNVAGNGPYRGALRHAGWEATKVELPEWTGGEEAGRVVAPAEVEVG